MVCEAIRLSIVLLLAMVRPDYLCILVLKVMSSSTYRNVRWYRGTSPHLRATAFAVARLSSYAWINK
jgi:hypothetical protein